MAKYVGIEKYIFADVYNFLLKYKDIPNEDYYWDCCVKDAHIITFKYKNHPLCVEMVASVLTQLQHIVCKTDVGGYTREQWEEMLAVVKK